MKEFYINIFDDIKNLFAKLVKDDIFALTGQLAYSLIMSLIPLIMFVIILAGQIALPITEIYDALKFVLPKEAFSIVAGILEEITRSNSWSLAILFSAIYFVSMGTRGIMKSLNKAYEEVEARKVVQLFFMSFVFAVLLGVAIILSFCILVFGRVIMEWIFLKLGFSAVPLFWQILRIVIAYLLLSFFFCLMYMAGPNLKLKIYQVYKGAFIAAFLWVVISIGFSAYVNNFVNYGLLFGSLGGAFLFFAWIYMTSFIILLGGELNSLLYVKEKKQ